MRKPFGVFEDQSGELPETSQFLGVPVTLTEFALI